MMVMYILRYAILAMELALAVGCQKAPPPGPTSAGERPLSIRTTRPERRQASEWVSLPGSLVARREATVSSKLPGLILYLQAEAGDTVSAGSILAEIDVSGLRARVRQAEAARQSAAAAVGQAQAARAQAEATLQRARAQLSALQSRRFELDARQRLADREWQRYRGLAEEGAIPRQQADRVDTERRVLQAQGRELEAQTRAAQMAINEARAALNQADTGVGRSLAGVAEAEAGIVVAASDAPDGTVKAPFRALVAEKFAHQGEVNVPGRALLKLQDLNSLEAVISVPDVLVEAIQPGTLHRLEIPALKLTREARVRPGGSLQRSRLAHVPGTAGLAADTP